MVCAKNPVLYSMGLSHVQLAHCGINFVYLGTVKPSVWLGNTAIAAADVATFTEVDVVGHTGFAFHLSSPAEYIEVTHVAMYAPPSRDDTDSLGTQCEYHLNVWDVTHGDHLGGGVTLSGSVDLGGVLSAELDSPIRVEASSVDDLFAFTVEAPDCAVRFGPNVLV